MKVNEYMQGERVDGFAGFQTIEQGSHEVNGRATDIGLGVSDVRVQVERIGGGAARYWNCTNFQAAPAWNVTTATEIGVFSELFKGPKEHW